jgi:carboxymethylenebutenolidase
MLLAILALLPLPATTLSADKKAERTTVGSFQSGGQALGVTRFDPASTGPHPAILLLHGLDGAQANAALYSLLATRLADQGYVVFVVRYFDRFANRPDELAFFQAGIKAHLANPNGPTRERLVRTFGECVATVTDGVRYARGQAGVDAERVGLIGFSLGGFVATATATQTDLKVTAVIELFGGLPDHLLKKAADLPPLLIVHGEQDSVVPVAAARQLEKAMKDQGASPEVKVYPNIGHVFQDAKGKFDVLTVLDAEQLAMTFLQRHLKRP